MPRVAALRLEHTRVNVEKGISIKTKLAEGKTVFGTFVLMGAPAVVEIVGWAGFGFVILDLEHGAMGWETVENMIRTAHMANTACLVRIPENTESAILRALDIGSDGIVVPHVDTKEAAEAAVRAAKYFPEGERGVDPWARSAMYSKIPTQQYFQKANRETVVVVLIEGMQGVENIDQILTVEGVDVIFVGPYDLSQAMGVPGEVDHPKLTEKMSFAVERARSAGRTVGIFAADAETARRWADVGVQFIAVSMDVGILLGACEGIVAALT
jgi:4-hydroxy-2-oxoheptanedioate aldolase